MALSQEAFDEMVLENMEEFDMTKEDALVETVNQLKSMGRDLSAIDITGGEVRRQILAALAKLRDNSGDQLETLRELQGLVIGRDVVNSKSHNIFRGSGGVSILLHFVNPNLDPNLTRTALEFLVNISKNNVDTRDLFEPGGGEKLCLVIASCISSPDTLSQEDKLQLLRAAFRCAKVMSRSENNKADTVGLMNHDINHLILQLFSVCEPSSSSNPVLKEVCLTMRSLCTHDDLRREMSCAYENSKKFLSDEFISYLMIYTRQYQSHSDLAASALNALRQLILSEEAVKVLCSFGIMSLFKEILTSSNASIPLIRSLLGLMRNICADDERKNTLVSDGILPVLGYYMSRPDSQSDEIIQEHILAILAAISLRYPSNAQLVVETHLVEEMVRVMSRHPLRQPLQRQGCLTIRNIAARCPELHQKLLDQGVENVIRKAGRLQTCVDEAYGALRDLKCEVQQVKLSQDGVSYEAAYESFGEKKKLQFNPVFEETYDIINRIDEKSEAPFANRNQSGFLIDEDDDDDRDDFLEHCHNDSCGH